MKNSIAFFDFDGTITSKDTLIEFIRYSKGTLALISGFLVNMPFLIALKLGLLSNQRAKERILGYFFNQMPESEFEKTCRSFVSDIVPTLLRPGAMDEIRKLQDEKVKIVIVSASPESWIRPWTDSKGLTLIATKLEISGGKITGRILGKNCHGEEKVVRIRKEFHLDDYQEIYAFGDTNGDMPMLALGTKSFMKPFRG